MNNKISLNPEIQNCINFPISQTNIPLVKRVWISNLTYDHLEELTLIIKTEPAISSEFSAPINYISPDSSVEVSPVALNMDLQKLLSTKEKHVTYNKNQKFENRPARFKYTNYGVDKLAKKAEQQARLMNEANASYKKQQSKSGCDRWIGSFSSCNSYR